MRRRLVTLALAVALTAGCGDEEEKGRTVTIDHGPARVVAHEYAFDPKTVVVESSGPLVITLENRGSLAHDLRVLDGDRELGGTPTFTAGETRSGTVEVAPGKYRMVCTVGNHEQLGMTGTLEVR